MFTKMELATDFNFTEVLQDYDYLHILLAPIKEKKVAHQVWIKVFTARDLISKCIPTIDINSCIILASITQPSNPLWFMH